MSESSDALKQGILLSLLGGGLVLLATLNGCWGARGIKDEYSFQYRGKPAVIKREDIRYGFDNYWIEMDSKDKVKDGDLISDDGKLIHINGAHYKVRDAD